MKPLKEKMDEAIADVSIDEFLARDPALVSREDVAEMVSRLRTMYANYITAEEKKKAKKEGQTTDQEDDDE